MKYLYFAYKAPTLFYYLTQMKNLFDNPTCHWGHITRQLKCLTHAAMHFYLQKIQVTQVFCIKQKVIKTECFLLHKEHETISMLNILLLFPSCHSFFLERTKQNTVIQSHKSMDNLNLYSTSKKLYKCIFLYERQTKQELDQWSFDLWLH